MLWLRQPPQIRQDVKNNCLMALGTEKGPKAAPTCVATLAMAEIPNKAWPDLIGILAKGVEDATNFATPESEARAEGCLRALSQICEDMYKFGYENDLLPFSNVIMNGVVSGIQSPFNNIQLESAKVLLAALPYCTGLFDNPDERDFLVCKVVEKIASQSLEVQIAIMEALTKMATHFYDSIGHCMPQLITLSFSALGSQSDDLRLMGIDFWTALSQEEFQRMEQLRESGQGMAGGDSSQAPAYVKNNIEQLAPIMFELLCKQEEDADDQDWSEPKSATLCLQSCAQACGESLAPLAFEFASTNVANENWRKRDASAVAIAAVLSGPDPQYLLKIVPEAIKAILVLCKDQSMTVRDSAIWCLGRACEHIKEAILQDNIFTPVLEAIRMNLTETPKVAQTAVCSLQAVMEACYEFAMINCKDGEEPETYPLSKMYEDLLTALITAAGRPDSTECNLRSSVYAALDDLMEKSPKDVYKSKLFLCNYFIENVQAIIVEISQKGASCNLSNHNDVLSSIIPIITNIIKKANAADVMAVHERLVNLMFSVLDLSKAHNEISADPEAFLCLGSIVSVMEAQFRPYLEKLYGYLVVGLQQVDEQAIVTSSASVIQDICRGELAGDIKQVVPGLMEAMFKVLACENDPTGIMRVAMMHTITDIALLCEIEFAPYLHKSIQYACTVFEATPVPTSEGSAENVMDLFIEVRAAYADLLSAVIGTVRFLDQSKPDTFKPFVVELAKCVGAVLLLVDQCANNEQWLDDGVMQNVGSIIGDIVGAFGIEVIEYFNRESIVNMLTKAKTSQYFKEGTRSQCSYALKMLKKAKSVKTAQTAVVS